MHSRVDRLGQREQNLGRTKPISETPLHKPLLLYSTNTWLAWAIASQYYKAIHWVWCSPFFRADGAVAVALPPSAIPGAIYDRLYEDVTRGDRHSAWIAKNRVGLIKGAECKEKAGVISSAQKLDILTIDIRLQTASLRDSDAFNEQTSSDGTTRPACASDVGRVHYRGATGSSVRHARCPQCVD